MSMIIAETLQGDYEVIDSVITDDYTDKFLENQDNMDPQGQDDEEATVTDDEEFGEDHQFNDDGTNEDTRSDVNMEQDRMVRYFGEVTCINPRKILYLSFYNKESVNLERCTDAEINEILERYNHNMYEYTRMSYYFIR